MRRGVRIAHDRHWIRVLWRMASVAAFSVSVGCASGTDSTSDAGGSDAASDLRVADLRPPNLTCKPPASRRDPPSKLSETGCVDPEDPRMPAAGLIPFDVSNPLWSDGATKKRFLALPDGATITVKSCVREPETCRPFSMGGTWGDDGHWDVPPGTVLVKHFLFGTQYVETRLLVRFGTDDWVGYGYEWNSEQTDALVLPDSLEGTLREIETATGRIGWYFPSRSECSKCHTDAAGVALGLETRQLNIDHSYPGGLRANQIHTLEAMGVFDEPLPRPLPPPYPSPSGSDGTPALRARAYLHINCAVCHRPESTFSDFDLRFSTAVAAMGVCDVLPTRGDLDVIGARLLIPGDPDKSLVSIRMRRTSTIDGRMPALATSVIDSVGTAAIDSWIRSLTDCR